MSPHRVLDVTCIRDWRPSGDSWFAAHPAVRGEPIQKPVVSGGGAMEQTSRWAATSHPAQAPKTPVHAPAPFGSSRLFQVLDHGIPSAIRAQGSEKLSRARIVMFVALVHIMVMPPYACAKIYVGAWSQAAIPGLIALLCFCTYGFGPRM